MLLKFFCFCWLFLSIWDVKWATNFLNKIWSEFDYKTLIYPLDRTHFHFSQVISRFLYLSSVYQESVHSQFLKAFLVVASMGKRLSKRPGGGVRGSESHKTITMQNKLRCALPQYCDKYFVLKTASDSYALACNLICDSAISRKPKPIVCLRVYKKGWLKT